MSEFSLKVYLHYSTDIKKEILIDKLIPILKENEIINDFFFNMHWAHGSHIEFVIKSDEKKEKFDPLIEEIRVALNNNNYEPDFIDIDTMEKTITDLKKMEEYAGEVLPIYENKTIEFTDYFIKESSNEHIRAYDSLYHEYYYKFSEPIITLLEMDNLSPSEKMILHLKFILSFSNNVLEDDALKSLYISFTSHFFSFENHEYSDLIKNYIKNFEQLYEKNKETFNLVLGEFLTKERTVSEDLSELIYKFSVEIKRINDQMDIEIKKQTLKDTKAFINKSFYEKSTFHKIWISQPNIDEIIMDDTYMINRFLVNFLYTLYPTLYISPKQKHLYGYVLYRFLGEYMDVNWTWEKV